MDPSPLHALSEQIRKAQGRMNEIATLLSPTEKNGDEVSRRIFNVTTGWWPCTVSPELEVRLRKEDTQDCLKVNFDPSTGVQIHQTAIAKVKSVTRVKYGTAESQYECIVITKESEKIRFICPSSEMIRQLFVLFDQPATCQLFSLHQRRIAYIKDYNDRTQIRLVELLREELMKEFNIDLQFEPENGTKSPYPLFYILKTWQTILRKDQIAHWSGENNKRSGGNGVWLVDYHLRFDISVNCEHFPQSGLFMNDPIRMIPTVLKINHGDSGNSESYEPAEVKRLAIEMSRLVEFSHEKGEG
jgi:hypothetical protein